MNTELSKKPDDSVKHQDPFDARDDPDGKAEESNQPYNHKAVVALAWVIAISLFFLIYLALTLLFTSSQFDWWRVYVLGKQPTLIVEPMGEVRRVAYVGGNWLDTQVDTTTHTLLLAGTVRVPHNVPMEIRRQDLEPALFCVVGTQDCMKLRE